MTSRIFELPERGVSLQVLDWGGEGPLALLSHANGFCAGIWDPLARGLAARFRVIAFDARGHGDSSKPAPPEAYVWGAFVDDLIALAERLTDERHGARVEFAIGHSFGGTVTLEAAARRPDLFGRIALLDPVFIPPPELLAQHPPRGTELSQRARRRREVWPTREAVRDAWQDREMFEDWDARAFEAYLSHGLRERDDGQIELKCPAAIEAAVFESPQRLEPLPAAKRLRAPALLVRAAQGHSAREVYAQVAQAAPDMRLIELDAGHLLPMIRPDEIAALLLRFAQKTR